MKDNQKLNEKEGTAIRNLTELCSDKNVAVSFSCGKDSLVVMDLASRIGINKAVFADTTIEFPETYDYLKIIKDFYDIEVVKPSKNFFSLVEILDLPSRRYRWCCDVLKFGPLQRYADKNGIVAYITGLRREESKRRECYDLVNFNPSMDVPQVNPILDWSSEDIWNYIKKYELPYNPLYEHFSRVGCWCCPYRSSEKDWRIIKQLYPKLFQEFQSLIEKKSNSVRHEYRDMFKDRGWTGWVYPLKKITVGKFEADEKLNVVKIKLNFVEGKTRIKNLISILDNDYSIKGNSIEIKIDDEKMKEDSKKIKVLVEKAINCIQCGSCLSLCEKRALLITDNITVDTDLCNKCGSCLIPGGNTKLRMMCVGRNYSRNRKTLIMS